MSVTKVTVDGMDLSSDVTLSGTTPTLTIGDAGAEDAAIVFDGNAQDFHIGLDDTADSLAIGLGSALGTTDHMVFDATGVVTKPLQPCVYAIAPGTQTNIAVDSDVTLIFSTEIFDVNGDFASNTFTAPVTGKYLVTYTVRLDDADSASTYYYLGIIASNRNYYKLSTFYQMNGDVGYWAMSAAVVIDADSSDTIHMVVRQSNGTSQTDISDTSTITYALLS